MARKPAEEVENVDVAPETTEAVEAAPESPEVPSEGQAFSVREFLKGHGAEVDSYESDEDAAKHLLSEYVRAQQERHQVETHWRTQHSAVERQLKELQKAQQESKAAAEKEKPSEFQWGRKLPEYDIDLLRSQVDPEGRLLPDADLKVREYQKSLQAHLGDLINKPHEFLDPVFKHRESEMERRLEEKFAALEQKVAKHTEETQFLDRLSAVAYDERGQFTPEGAAYVQAVAQFRENAPKELHGTKTERLYGQQAMQLAVMASRMAQGKPAETQDDKRREFLGNKTRKASRSGAVKDNTYTPEDLHKPGGLRAAMVKAMASGEAA